MLKENTQVGDTITLDASGKSLGRLASEAARYLQGKHKPAWAPNVDGGACVLVQNLLQARLTGGKLKSKLYYRHTTYPGHLKKSTMQERWRQSPQRLFVDMVAKMLPKNKLRKERLKRLTFV